MNEILNSIGLFFNNLPLIGTLIILMLMDVVSGVIAAGLEKKLSSKISYQGVSKKVGILFAVALGTILRPYAANIPLDLLIAAFFLYSEALSNLENLKKLGIEIPFLNNWLAVKSRAAQAEAEGAVGNQLQVGQPGQPGGEGEYEKAN